MNNTITCKGICKKYADKTVLKDIDLILEKGKIYGLIGRNGAGKTTLLSVISAQNPATEGIVTVEGEPVWENQNALNKLCFARELNTSTVTGNGLAAMKMKDYLKLASVYYEHWDAKLADELVKEFDLEPKKKLGEVSKGMQSMVTIIVAMASKAEYTFLDEPVAGLDVIMRKKFYDLLLREYEETGRTFVISTHIIEEATNLFEEVILLKDGGILLKANTQELMDSACHVSGKEVDVDAATKGLPSYGAETIGRSKGVTVFLKPGETIRAGYDVSTQPVSLQNIFVALCGTEEMR